MILCDRLVGLAGDGGVDLTENAKRPGFQFVCVLASVVNVSDVVDQVHVVEIEGAHSVVEIVIPGEADDGVL